MMLYFFLALFATVATIVWLRHTGRGESQLGIALYAVLGLQAVGLLVSWFQPNEYTILGVQLFVWVFLMWGLELPWSWIGSITFGVGLLGIIPPLALLPLLTWGSITAVPGAAFISRPERLNVPIIAPSIPVSSLRPVRWAEPDLSQMIESQRPILECMSDGVLFTGRDGLIAYANQATQTIVGMPPQELIGKSVTDVASSLPMLASAQQDSMSRFEMNGRIIQGEMHLIYRPGGEAAGTVAIMRDITTQFKAEEARDRFLTTISHELRTPLTVIKGYVELLQGGAGGALSPQQRQFFKTIQDKVNHLIDLINSLIFVSSLKEGRLDYGAGLTNLRQLAQQIARELLPEATATDQEIEVDIDARLPQIQTDPIHMSIILEELIGNAIKYNRRGGHVRVQAVLERDKAQQQEFVVVSVADEGIGIDAGVQERLFEEFYRPDARDEEIRAGGMGVGLPIVRALVEAYNGRIWYDSTPGAGSTFYFIVPVQQPDFPLFRPTVDPKSA